MTDYLEKTRKKVFRFSLITLVLACCIGNWWYYRIDTYISRTQISGPIMYSLDNSYIKDNSILTVDLYGDMEKHVEIYYTTDGSIPTKESNLYTDGITLSSGGKRVCFPVKIVLVQGSDTSPVFVKTFFPENTAVLNENISAVSITGDPADFYSSERGILALGAASEEEALKDETLPLNFLGIKRANYYGRGLEWERPVYVEIYDSDGNTQLLQNCGIRVTGGASRDNLQKSLRLYARTEYDVNGAKFPAQLVKSDVSVDGSETPLTEYNHIDLRAGGNDWPFTMLNDPTMRMLAAQSGLAPVTSTRPVVVYINGEYYGLAWLQPDYSEKNLAEMCSLENYENIYVVESSASVTAEGDMVNVENPQAVEYFNYMKNLVLSDLNVAENRELLEQVLDIDNMLTYYILNMYSNNMDWPANNYKAWCYVNADETEKENNSYADGRWRFLFFDADASYNTYVDATEGFDWLFAANKSPMLASLMKYEGYRDRFVTLWSTLLQTTLSEENTKSVIWQQKDIIEAEMQFRESLDPNEIVFGRNYRQIMYIKLENFLNYRPSEVQQKIQQYLGVDVSDSYTLTVHTPADMATVYIDSYKLEKGSSFTAEYCNSVALTLSCDTAVEYTVTGWQVNGQTVNGQTLCLDDIPEDTQTIVVSPIIEKRQPGLKFSAFRYRGKTNWLELTNYSDSSLSLDGYKLTINGNQSVYALPAITLAPGQTIKIWDETSELSREQLGQHGGRFDLKHGDIIRLFTPADEMADSVFIPAKNPSMIYSRSPYSNDWIWKEMGQQ